MPPNEQLSRRRFLQGAAALGVPFIIPASAYSAQGVVAPSNRINIGCIGIGGMGGGHLGTLLGMPDVQVVAVCDVDAKHADNAKGRVEKKYAAAAPGGTYKGCAVYNDFRELLARPDIDAVMVATPDHWHALIGIAAAEAGKDMYIEKPLTLTIAQGRALSDAVARYGRIHQTGSQQRSSSRFRIACELVRNGRIGKVHTIRVGLPTGRSTTVQPEMPVPPELDYNLWLGPAPYEPYTAARVHYHFRWLQDYSGGQVTNFGAHDLDIAQWAMDMDNSGPVEVEGRGEYPEEGLYDNPTRVKFNATYANGVKLFCETGSSGVRFEGSDGWVYVNRGTLQAEPRSLLNTIFGPDEIHLYESRSHWGNFIDCVRTRRQPICPAETGHRTATFCHLANIAMNLGRKVRWNPQAERFVDDPEADRMISRPMRAPWHL